MRLWRRKTRWSEVDLERALAIIAADEATNSEAPTWYATSPEDEASALERFDSRIRVIPVYPLWMAKRG